MQGDEETHGERGVVRQSRAKRIPNRKVHSNRIQIMFKHDEPSIHRARIPQDRLERRERVRAGDKPTRDLPVVRIELAGLVGTRPDDGHHTHSEGNGADTVVDVAVRGTHGCGCDAEDGLDGFAGPAEFGDDFFGGEGGEVL